MYRERERENKYHHYVLNYEPVLNTDRKTDNLFMLCLFYPLFLNYETFICRSTNINFSEIDRQRAQTYRDCSVASTNINFSTIMHPKAQKKGNI